jgi:hypothetical protein
LDTPGRFEGSYVTPSILSVRATRSFFVIVEDESVIKIRDLGFGADFDILWVGRSRAITRFAGAAKVLLVLRLCNHEDHHALGSQSACVSEECLHSNVSGCTRILLPAKWLKPAAHSRANSKCCDWSWPTGTCVALCTRMSAACSTG